MDKALLLKRIFDYYGYSYKFKENGTVEESEDGDTGYLEHNSIDEALVDWLNTLESTNSSKVASGESSEEFNVWTEDEINLIRSIQFSN